MEQNQIIINSLPNVEIKQLNIDEVQNWDDWIGSTPELNIGQTLYWAKVTEIYKKA